MRAEGASPYFPKRRNLFSRIDSKSQVVFLACPLGYMMKPESSTLFFLLSRLITTLVGIPSGYFKSYSYPPCSNSIFSIIFRVSLQFKAYKLFIVIYYIRYIPPSRNLKAIISFFSTHHLNEHLSIS